MLDLGVVGPAQSDYLYHFTGRNGQRPDSVPESIQGMSAQERLDSILREKQFRAYAPFGATTPCICFSESPPDHLKYLLGIGRFSPWGIVTHRSAILSAGGGSVAYVPDAVHAQFQQAGLAHWSVRTATGSTWMHEREWRLPRPQGTAGIHPRGRPQMAAVARRDRLGGYVHRGSRHRGRGQPVRRAGLRTAHPVAHIVDMGLGPAPGGGDEVPTRHPVLKTAPDVPEPTPQRRCPWGHRTRTWSGARLCAPLELRRGGLPR